MIVSTDVMEYIGKKRLATKSCEEEDEEENGEKATRKLSFQTFNYKIAYCELLLL